MNRYRKLPAAVLAVLLTCGAAILPARAANSCDGVVIASSLALRSGAGSRYVALANVPRGTPLTVIGISTEDSNWFKVNHNGTIGYMAADYVMSASSSEAAAAIADAANLAFGSETINTVQTPPPTAAPVVTVSTPTPTNDPNDPTWKILTPEGSSNATVTGELVRFRSTPGGSIVGNFQNRARINVTAVSGSWYEVNCNGTAGYVHSNYVTLDASAAPAQQTQPEPVPEQPVQSVPEPVPEQPAPAPVPVVIATPEPTPVPVVSTPVPVNAGAGQSIVSTAMQYTGVPYVWGGTSPSGFDCSGLCYYVYQQCGYTIQRVADSIYRYSGVTVSADQLAPGDIVCFGSSSYVSHVGIYVGNGQYIHAPNTGAVVRVDALNRGDIVCGKRIV